MWLTERVVVITAVLMMSMIRMIRMMRTRVFWDLKLCRGVRASRRSGHCRLQSMKNNLSGEHCHFYMDFPPLKMQATMSFHSRSDIALSVSTVLVAGSYLPRTEPHLPRHWGPTTNQSKAYHRPFPQSAKITPPVPPHHQSERNSKMRSAVCIVPIITVTQLL
jgi:hypothetical protein